MRKRILIIVILALVIASIGAGLMVRATIKSVPALFERNAELKAQGYYMGAFEFKMLGVVYYLNEGDYLKAYTTLRRIITEMKTTEGLLKMPQGGSAEERMAFLLDRQDPTTGAFMDPQYPIFTYIGPTLNIVDVLDDLSQQIGRPLKLKYPFHFLDEIQTPQQLRAYLDPLLYINESWADMGGPGPYGAGASEMAAFGGLEQRGLYSFSEAWKNTLRQWFYQTQDPNTGYWGVRIGTPSNWRQNLDPNSTYHIIKFVVDEWGENRDPKYPLRYAATLAHSILKSLTAPIPRDPTEQHAWGLDQSQGARMITRRLWPHLSDSEKEQVRTAMQTWLTERYRLFRPTSGGFAIHTSDTQSDVDGTSTALLLLRATGSLLGTQERERLWGHIAPAKQVRTEIHNWKDVSLPTSAQVNSVRIYKNTPPTDNTYDDTHLEQIIYPKDTPILDVMDLRQNIDKFIASDGQALGNWVAKESLRDKALDLRRKIKTVPVSQGALNLGQIGKNHPDAKRFYVIGYDLFQVPCFRMEFVKVNNP